MKKRTAFRRNGRGSLLFICCLLLGSAAIRIGGEAGKAVATENPFPVAAGEIPSASPAGSSMDPSEVSAMLAAFNRREERIERMEQEIAVRQQALRLADEEIEKRLQVLQKAEESLRALLTIADTAAEDDLVTLTSVYENMKPKDAAPLFEEMEPGFAAGFLGRMRPDAAAGIMAGLSPQKAYTISVILAGRNAEAPKG
jgi:flagellar motility protein MotE (MotC chaperone)